MSVLSSMPLPRKIALALVAGVGALLAAHYLYTPRRATHPIDAVPADAFVAIEIDVAAVRKTGALATLFGDPEEQSLTSVCGFDPVDRMSRLVFTVPEGATGDFGVAVEAGLSRDELVRCAEAVVKGHGGDPTSDVVERGPYSVITPRSTSSESSKPPRSLAYANSDSPILVGPRGWIYTMADTLEDASLGRGTPGEHVTLRQRLVAEITPTPVFLVTATALLDRNVRDKLKTEMLNQVGTAEDSGTSMMLGVLGMTSGVLGLYMDGSDVHAVIDLNCEHEPECAQVERLISKVRDEWSKMPALRDFGLAGVLDRVTIGHRDTKLTVRTSAPASDVVNWTRLLLGLSPAPVTATIGQVMSQADIGHDVPTQTLRVTVPPGTKPGDPISITVGSPTKETNGQVRNIVGTPAASASARGKMIHLQEPSPTP